MTRPEGRYLSPEETRLQRIEDKLNSVCSAVESGFPQLKRDVSLLTKLYAPPALIGLLALIISVLSLFVASTNRELIMAINHSDQQQQIVLNELERRTVPQNGTP